MGKKTVKKVEKTVSVPKKFDPLTDAAVEENMAKIGVVAAYQNNLYAVLVFTHESNAILDSNGGSTIITQLVVIKKDKSDNERIPWEHAQIIKNEVCDPEADGAELYPAMSRVKPLGDMHIWVAPAGGTWPFGYFNTSVIDRRSIDMVPELKNVGEEVVEDESVEEKNVSAEEEEKAEEEAADELLKMRQKMRREFN